MVLSARARKLIKWLGYPLFALFWLVVFFYVTFPYDRLRTMIEEHAAASGEMDLSIGDVSPSPLFGVTLSDVRIEFAPPPTPLGRVPAAAKPDKPPRPRKMLIEEVTVNTSLFALLGAGVDLAFELRGLGGTVEGEYAASKEGFSADVQVDGIKLQYIPQVADAVGLPVRGRLSGKVVLAVPKNVWQNASGSVELSCKDGVIGDGKAKLKIPGNPLLAQGIKMPRVRLGTLGGRVDIEKGVATLADVSARSPDIEIHLEGKVNLRQPVGFSMLNGYLRFKISPELKRRDPKFELLENGLANAKRTDGFYGMRLSGSLKNVRTFPSKTGPGGGGVGVGGRLRRPSRPPRRLGR